MNEPTVSLLNKDAKSILHHLFYDKMISLEKDVKFSKQIELSKCQNRVLLFIEHNPYSEFEVRVLHKNTEDTENYKIAISFRNYEERTEKRPNRFVIILDSAFNSITFYQWSLNNILLEV